MIWKREDILHVTLQVENSERGIKYWNEQVEVIDYYLKVLRHEDLGVNAYIEDSSGMDRGVQVCGRWTKSIKLWYLEYH